MKNKSKYPVGVPDPKAVAASVAEKLDFDNWDDWTGDLTAALRTQAIKVKGHGIFKELYTSETHNKIVRMQDNDRHIIVPNMKLYQGGIHANS